MLPGGETRSVTYFAPYPLAITAAHGTQLVDADGNTYLDLVNNYTSLVHGNAFPPVVQALREAVGDGTAYASTHPAQVRLAETICARVPSIERVRFTNSGSEAGALALRIARRVTGRYKTIVFDGGYHGGLPLLTAEDPSVITVPYNDLEALERALDPDVAAVFAEPFLGAGGVVPSAEGFLRRAAEITRAAGGLFVLDEVQSLRNHIAGQQTELGVTPDLTTLGKVIGGGLAIGAVGGRADLLDVTAHGTPGQLTHSGTFNGQVLAACAGHLTLEHLTEQAIATLNDRADRLGRAIETAAAEADTPCVVSRAGSILNVHLYERLPRTAADVRALPARSINALHVELLNQGIYTTPRGMINLSTVLTEEDLAQAISGYRRAFRQLSS